MFGSRFLIGALVVFALFLYQNAFAQPDTLWTRTFGGGNFECGQAVFQTIDKGYILSGSTDSYGAGWRDWLVIKIDSMGSTQWIKTYGGGSYDAGGVMIPIQGGAEGYIGAGMTLSFGAGAHDGWVIRINSLGDTIWTKTYGGSSWDVFFECNLTEDKGLIMTGSESSFGIGGFDIWLMKIDSLGNTEWEKAFGTTADDQGNGVIQTMDKGYIVTGFVHGDPSYNPTSNGDICLIKTDSFGNEMWMKTYGGSFNDYGTYVIQNSNGEYIIAGTTASYGGGQYDIWIIKTDSLGDTIWTRTFGGGENDPLRSWRSHCLTQVNDSEYVVAGATASYSCSSGIYDGWLLKFNDSGDTLWTKVLGGLDEDWFVSVQQCNDNGFIIIGTTKSFGAGDYDTWVIKMKSGPVGIEENSKFNAVNLLQNSPNPFIGSTEIRYVLPNDSYVDIIVYNLSGQKIATIVSEYKNAGYHTVMWDGKDNSGKKLASGVYFCRLKTPDYTATKKMYLIH